MTTAIMNTGAASLSDAHFTAIRIAQCASCTCLTKTPEVKFHAADCRYRLLEEVLHALSTPTPQADADFKNFHRLLCERFGYVHDEKDWRRDQVSLIECIAKKLETVEKDSARYRRFRRWHPRLQTSYWTGKWWEPIYGEKMDACVDWLDEVPQPTPHADQCDSALLAASNGEQA